MKLFNNSGKEEEYKPIIKLSNGQYLVNFGKVSQVVEEKVMKNSRLVGTGKMVPTGSANWRSLVFDAKPSQMMIQNTIFDIINQEVSNCIENKFRWNGFNVHLDLNNQMNYKNAFDLAVATSGDSLPVTFKFEKAGKPEYYVFENVADLKKFYLAVNAHIQKCLENGWKEKDKLNIEDYVI